MAANALHLHTRLSGPSKVLHPKLFIDIALPCNRTQGTILIGSTSVKASRLNGCLCMIGSDSVIGCQRVRIKRLTSRGVHIMGDNLSPSRHCIAGTLLGIHRNVGVGPVRRAGGLR